MSGSVLIAFQQLHRPVGSSQPISASTRMTSSSSVESNGFSSSPSSGNADRRARPVRDDPRPEDGRDQVPDVVVAAGLPAGQPERPALAGAPEPAAAPRARP